ncbi:hypothetical protein [Rhodopila globiformis]|uniref:hypothetical protein n=1 Tax=Rhodopila globiformis TaxID=1071 RepID=UPI00187650CF|nr:hypothetical protein [Rhodopila globiformis]
MMKRARAIASASAVVLLVTTWAQAADQGAERAVKVDDGTFKCITDMTAVRHFYVDNLAGNLKGTVAVAEAGKGDYPEGSVVQLVPTEVMIKQQKGFNPVTHDWEFFAIDVSKDGSKIYQRGFENVNNRFGLNCFACHRLARKEFDLICEENHGCAPIPITRPMFRALQKTDPRCKTPQPLTQEDKQALVDLAEVVKTLKPGAEPEKKQ